MATDARRDAIASYYRQYLGREPDEAGLNYYANSSSSLDQIQSDLSRSPEGQDFARTTASRKLDAPGVGDINAGLGGLVDLAAQYKDNETLSGLAVGKIGDVLSTQANTGQAIKYQSDMLGVLGPFMQAQKSLDTGNALQLMTAEAGFAKDIQKDQLATQRYGAELGLQGIGKQAEAQRYGAELGLQGIESQSAAQRYSEELRSAAQKYSADTGLKGIESQSAAQRYGAELGLKGIESQTAAQRYASELDANTRRYGAELGLEGVKAQAGATRDVGLAQADATKYAASEQAGATKYAASQQAGAQRYSAELGLKGVESQTAAQRYTADVGFKGVQEQTAAQRYGYDQQLAGTKYVSDSEERRIGLTGEENRKTLREQTDQTLALRADARGAVQRAGARFYG